jgi:hypothetical protein
VGRPSSIILSHGRKQQLEKEVMSVNQESVSVAPLLLATAASADGVQQRVAIAHGRNAVIINAVVATGAVSSTVLANEGESFDYSKLPNNNAGGDHGKSGMAVALALDRDGSALATADDTKTVRVYRNAEGSSDSSSGSGSGSSLLPRAPLTGTTLMTKKATSLHFALLPDPAGSDSVASNVAPDDLLLAADKTGDVIGFPAQDVSRGSKILLGHSTSQSLPRCSLTRSRDEKIRVSHFLDSLAPRTPNNVSLK